MPRINNYDLHPPTPPLQPELSTVKAWRMSVAILKAFRITF